LVNVVNIWDIACPSESQEGGIFQNVYGFRKSWTPEALFYLLIIIILLLQNLKSRDFVDLQTSTNLKHMPVNNHDIDIDDDGTTPHHYHHRFSSDNSHKTVDWGLGMHEQQ
jgi:hypothetical protein